MTRVLLDRQRFGKIDLEASEMAIRAMGQQIGGCLLEKLLNADGGGYCGRQIDCGRGHRAKFVEYRTKQLTTVLAPLEVRRAYYYCESCREGVIPKDRALDIVGTSFSPGVRRMMAHVGAKESFDDGRCDLEALAGVRIKTKAVERISESIGEQIERISEGDRKAVLSGKVVPLKSVPKMYIAMDGTGVPVVPCETEGRRGKDVTGKAKTREAKLGCVFTQTGLNEKGRPVRDAASTTYTGAIETAEDFGSRIFAEGARRGVARAKQVIVLGDGAHWIWGIAEEHFHGAIQIVDLYHAREHLSELGKILYGSGSASSKAWTAARSEELDAGDVEQVVAAMKRRKPRQAESQEAVRKAIGYFERNADRMRYAQFRSQDLFVGSGVMEAGCRTIVGQRLKQSGMRWTVRGANSIIALRCAQLSGRWEEFWEACSAA